MTDIKTKAEVVKKSIDDVYWDWGNMSPSDGTTITVAALREVINQLQQSPGIISCADLLELCEELEKI